VSFKLAYTFNNHNIIMYRLRTG